MAKNEIVWGIDVGNTSLKALRCRRGEEPGTLEVLGFDFIEHSKVMSQPGADAAEILAESLSLFLSRNNIKGEKVAISVSGQSALWRFQPLPPVDARKIKDLVKYEVRQWLPFDLDEVIWTFRQVGGSREGSLLLDSNIFMYAMKKELTYKTLGSYSQNGITVDCIQGAPIALFNSYVNEFYTPEELEGKDPTELTDFDIILNVGTDTTEVVITNGVVVWLRNIPIGGNLFTKSLTKTLKLTFSNAEHIKRNAATSQDPKAVILAMKPVFNEMLSEIDRSIKYYCSLNKQAKIRRIYALGNAMKLPGLRQFLAKSHGIEVIVPNSFTKLRGPEVLSNPQFTGNLSSFAISYGLALELLHKASLDINLIPAEVVRDRIINAKKPWALAAAAMLLLAMTVQYVSSTVAFGTVENEAINSAVNQAKTVNDLSKKITGNVSSAVSEFKSMDTIGKNLTSNVEGRITWLELIKTINSVIPSESLPSDVFSKPAREKVNAITNQNRIFIQNVEVVDVPDLASWFDSVREFYSIDKIEEPWFEEGSEISLQDAFYFPPPPETGVASSSSSGTSKTAGTSKVGGASKSTATARASGTTRRTTTTASTAAASTAAAKSSGARTTAKTGATAGGGATSSSPTSLTADFKESNDPRLGLIPGPSGAGRVVQLTCFHYHNPAGLQDSNRGPEYVRREFLPLLKHGEVELPVSLERQRTEGAKQEKWSMREFGIYYPVMVNPGSIDDNFQILDPEAANEEYRRIQRGSVKGRSGRGSSGRMTSSAGRSIGSLDEDGGSMGMSADRLVEGIRRSGGGDEKILTLRRFDFVVQFVWQETPPSVREARRMERKTAEKETTASATANGEGSETEPAAPGATGKASGNSEDSANSPDSAAPPAAPSGDEKGPDESTDGEK